MKTTPVMEKRQFLKALENGVVPFSYYKDGVKVTTFGTLHKGIIPRTEDSETDQLLVDLMDEVEYLKTSFVTVISPDYEYDVDDIFCGGFDPSELLCDDGIETYGDLGKSSLVNSWRNNVSNEIDDVIERYSDVVDEYEEIVKTVEGSLGGIKRIADSLASNKFGAETKDAVNRIKARRNDTFSDTLTYFDLSTFQWVTFNISDFISIALIEC